jgi:hypothetical protein
MYVNSSEKFALISYLGKNNKYLETRITNQNRKGRLSLNITYLS